MTKAPGSTIDVYEVLRDIVGNEHCRYSASGYCQTHVNPTPCPFDLARSLLAAHDKQAKKK